MVRSFLCAPRLSITTMSPGRSEGTSTSRKTSVLVAPSIGHARARAVQANRGDYRGGAPMFVRCMANQPFTPGRAATQARHVRLGRRLVDEDKPGRVEPALAALPATP